MFELFDVVRSYNDGGGAPQMPSRESLLSGSSYASDKLLTESTGPYSIQANLSYFQEELKKFRNDVVCAFTPAPSLEPQDPNNPNSKKVLSPEKFRDLCHALKIDPESLENVVASNAKQFLDARHSDLKVIYRSLNAGKPSVGHSGELDNVFKVMIEYVSMNLDTGPQALPPIPNVSDESNPTDNEEGVESSVQTPSVDSSVNRLPQPPSFAAIDHHLQANREEDEENRDTPPTKRSINVSGIFTKESFVYFGLGAVGWYFVVGPTCQAFYVGLTNNLPGYSLIPIEMGITAGIAWGIARFLKK